MFASYGVSTPNGTWYYDTDVIAGEDLLGVMWSLNNRSFPVGTDAGYKTVNLRLCYVPVSQAGKPGRKTEDDVDKDKICPIEFYTGPYNASSEWQYYESTLDGHIPAACTGPEKDNSIFEISGGSSKRIVEMMPIGLELSPF